MAVKFRVRFTMDGETLFGLIAKALPIEDLHVEEVVVEGQGPMRAPPVAISRMHAITKPMKVSRGRGRRFGELNLQAGANAIVIKYLSDGKPHKASDMNEAFVAAGYSKASVGSRLLALHQHGIVFQPEFGLWQLKQPLAESA